jgi:hypothetical protein
MDGTRLVQRFSCRAGVLPNGAPGAWWRGVLYPLLPSGADGSACIDVGTPAPAAPVTAHALLAGEEASWVLVQGSTADLEAARTALARNGVAISRHGRWLGEPVAGRDFDFFLRCDGWLEAELVDRLLGHAAIDAPMSDPAARVAVLEQRLADMRAELSSLRALLVRAQRASPTPDQPVQMPAEPTVSYAALQAALARADALEARLQHAASPAPRAVLRLKDELAEILAALRPDVILLRDSPMVITGEFSSRTGILRAIAELPQAGSRPEGWKMLRGADRWWERHVNTGSNDLGRAYARFDTHARRWSLLVGMKADQQQDIDWLNRQG